MSRVTPCTACRKVVNRSRERFVVVKRAHQASPEQIVHLECWREDTLPEKGRTLSDSELSRKVLEIFEAQARHDPELKNELLRIARELEVHAPPNRTNLEPGDMSEKK